MAIELDVVTETVLALVVEIKNLSEDVYIHQIELRDAQDALKRAETTALLGTGIDGKNEAIRQAQLAEATQMERIELEMADRKVLKGKLNLAAAELLYKTWMGIGDWHFPSS